MNNFARGYFRLSHHDEAANKFRQERVLSQAIASKSTVVSGKVYSVLIPLYPTAYLFGKGQTITLEIGSVNTSGIIPPMRHEGGDRLPQRFDGENCILPHGRLVLPRVRR